MEAEIMECRTVAIITARGGSKRIPKKNIKEFCGKPILAYSIKAALDSQIFDEVMVSTDSEEIAEVARQYGAKVPFVRSAKTSDDYATTRDVLLEVLGKYISMGYPLKEACCIYPTAPFVTAERLREGRKLLDRPGVYMVNPVVKFSFPPQRGIIINDKGILQSIYMENRFVRSQDLEDIYHDSGQFYWYDVEKFMENDGIMDGYSAPLIMDELHVQDIDNETDWEIAEMKYEIMKKKGLL